MITNLLKRIKITKHQCAFPEDDTKRVETYCSCVNCKIIYIILCILLVLYNFQSNYFNIAVHRNTTKPAQH